MWNDRDFGNYIAGQADADSSFYINVKYGSRGVYVCPEWTITKDIDKEILEKICHFLGVGKVYPRRYLKTKRNTSASLRIHGKPCARVVQFFEEFPLRAKKKEEFEIWKRAVEIYVSRKRNVHNPWVKEELIEMKELRRKLHQSPSRIRRRSMKEIEIV